MLYATDAAEAPLGVHARGTVTGQKRWWAWGGSRPMAGSRGAETPGRAMLGTPRGTEARGDVLETQNLLLCLGSEAASRRRQHVIWRRRGSGKRLGQTQWAARAPRAGQRQWTWSPSGGGTRHPGSPELDQDSRALPSPRLGFNRHRPRTGRCSPGSEPDRTPVPRSPPSNGLRQQ